MLAGRVAMFVYWIFDNINLLCTLKLLKRDPEWFGKMGMFSWFVSLVLNLVQFFRTLHQINGQIKFYNDFCKKNPEKADTFKDDLKKYYKQRTEAILNLIKTLGDIFPSFKGSGLAEKIGFSWINDLWCGAGGTVSAVIFLYQTYK